MASFVALDAEVLVEYDHPHFGRWPAVTTRRHGEGSVTYVGTVPGRALAHALARWLAPFPFAPVEAGQPIDGVLNPALQQRSSPLIQQAQPVETTTPGLPVSVSGAVEEAW